MATEPKKLSDVRKALCEMYEQVISDRRMSSQVHEGSNALGKVIGSCKVHLDACKMADKKLDGEWKDFILS